MKKIIILILCIITSHIDAMIIPMFPKEMNVHIYSHILSSSVYLAVEEANDTLKNLARVNKSWNLCINDSENTLFLIKQLSKKFNLSNEEVADKLSIASAQFRYVIQKAALDWSGESRSVCENLGKLRARGLDLNFTYKEASCVRETLLMTTIYWPVVGYFNIGEWLIKHGADINVTTKNKKNASMLALYYFHFHGKMIPLFLDHPKLDITHSDEEGNTLLHYCFSKGIAVGRYSNQVCFAKCAAMCSVIEKLLQKGVDGCVVNNAGETAFDLAKKTGYEPFLKILDPQYNS